jgi:hypothetical protein
LGFRKDSPHGDTYAFAVSLVDDFRYMMMDPSAGWYQDIDDTADDGDVFMDAQSMHPLFDPSIETGGDYEEFHDALTEAPMTEDDPGFNGNPGDTYWDHYLAFSGAGMVASGNGLTRHVIP